MGQQLIKNIETFFYLGVVSNACKKGHQYYGHYHVGIKTLSTVIGGFLSVLMRYYNNLHLIHRP